MKKLLLLKSAFVLLFFLAVSKGYGQIAAWDFTGIGSSSTAATPATTFNANLVATSSANNITRGATAPWSTANNSWRTVGFKNEGISTANTDYFQITLTAATGYKLSLASIDARLAGTATFAVTPGVSNQFAYSLDGATFTLIGSPQVTIGTPATLPQIDLSAIAALQNIDAGTTVTIRYYASGQTATGGWGFNSPSAGQNGLAIGGSLSAAGTTNTWLGTTNSWSTGTNWSAGVPTATSDVVIPAGTPNSPSNFGAPSTISSLTVAAGATLTNSSILNVSNLFYNNGTIGSGTLNVAGAVINNGSINNSVGFNLNGTSAQTLTGTGTYSKLTLNNALGATITSGKSTVTGTVTLQAGTLAAGGNLVLASSATGTASIAAIDGTINTGSIIGNVVCQKYIAGGGLSTDAPSQRAYRFLAHPFTTSIALSQLQTAIDITGTGTGFDASASGSPSAFRWNPATANGASNDAGWTAITNTTTATWGGGEGMRVFYRGIKGTGLNGGAYTVGSATLSMTGPVTTGTRGFALNYQNAGTTSNFNFIGNPYPSNVQMSGVTNVNTSSSYYVWNLALGSKGGYSTVSFGSSYVLPAYAGFFVETVTSGGSVGFHETDKTTSAATNTLLRNNTANQLKLQLKSGNILWDELVVETSKDATAAKEYADAKKLLNPDVSIYAISSDNAALAIDKRNIQAGDIIPLGLTTTVARNFTLEISELGTFGVEFYLRDKYMDVMQKVEAGSSYTFFTDAYAASQGNNRFELLAKQAPLILPLVSSFSIKLSPNPAMDMVKVSFSNEEKANTVIALTNAEGKAIKTIDAGNVKDGQVSINLKGFAKGTYYITLSNAKERKTEKLQVQ